MEAGIGFYRDRLRVNRHRLDEELEEHAQRLEEIGRRCAHLNRAVERARVDRDMAMARLVRRLKASEPKATAPIIEAEAAFDEALRACNEALRDAQLEHSEWEALNRAWYQRGFDLKALGELYGAQYFAIDSVSGDAARGERRKGPDAEARRAMRDASAAVDQFRRMAVGPERAGGVRRRPS